MTKSTKKQMLWGLLFLTVVLIVYNYWSFRNGRCTMTTLMSLSPGALILLACNLLAALSLFALKLRKRVRARHSCCACGQQFSEPTWEFCPGCGKKLR